MKNSHIEIYLFLKGESEEGLEIISNIFFKQLHSQSYKFLTQKEDANDIFMDFITKLLTKREFLLETFEGQTKGLASYIRQMAKNFLKDKVKQWSEIQIESVNNNEGKLGMNYNIDTKTILKIESFRFEKTLKQKFKEEEVLILCYITAPDKIDFINRHFSNLSKNALYKRVERVKNKLKNLIDEYGYEKDVVEFYIDNILPIICNKRTNNE